jgi:hypothetical protein
MRVKCIGLIAELFDDPYCPWDGTGNYEFILDEFINTVYIPV